MTVKTIRIDKAQEIHHKVLNAMFDDELHPARINYGEIATKIGVSEEVIRYNVRKLKKLGYIREQDGKYEPTERIVRLKYNAK